MKNSKDYEIKISKNVLKIIASIAIKEIDTSSRIKRMCIISDKKRYTIYAYISMEAGLGLTQKTHKMKKNVINQIKVMTGLNIDKVNLYVYDIFHSQVL